MNRIGKSDLYVRPIAFGAMSLGDSQSLNIHLLRKAFDQGINYFDTADLYQHGFNEQVIGDALRPVRHDVVLATKVGNQVRPDGNGWDWNPRKAYIVKSVEASLSRLKTDYIDLYQLHGGTIEDPIEETIEAFELLKQQGKIRWYGISSIRPNVIREYAEKSNIVSVMMQYSLLDRRPEEEMLGFLADKEISVIARGVLAKGLLIGREVASYLQYSSSEVKSVAKSVRQSSEELGYKPIDVAAAYVLGHETIAAAVLGLRTEAQLDEVIGVLQTDVRLSTTQRNDLAAHIRRFRYEEHR